MVGVAQRVVLRTRATWGRGRRPARTRPAPTAGRSARASGTNARWAASPSSDEERPRLRVASRRRPPGRVQQCAAQYPAELVRHVVGAHAAAVAQRGTTRVVVHASQPSPGVRIFHGPGGRRCRAVAATRVPRPRSAARPGRGIAWTGDRTAGAREAPLRGRADRPGARRGSWTSWDTRRRTATSARRTPPSSPPPGRRAASTSRC